MSERLLMICLVLLLVIGCKWSSTTAQNEDGNSRNAANTAAAETVPAKDAEPKATPSPAATQTANAVCPDPAKPCHHKEKKFDEWELSFQMPAKMAVNKMYRSAPFYALILKTYASDDDCDGGEYIEAIEAERKQLQRSETARKVFASYECPNMAAVDYDFDGKWDAKKETALIGNFLAIYAGDTKEQAEELLKKLSQKYPDSAVKRMTAGYEIIYQ